MNSPDLALTVWRKSTRSQPQGQNCVEIAALRRVIAVRDSKDPDGPTLIFGREDWRKIAARIKRGSYDLT